MGDSIRDVWRLIREDARVVSDGRPSVGFLGVYRRWMFNVCFRAVVHHRIAHHLIRRRGMGHFARLVALQARMRYAIEISPFARIGKGFRIVHGVGVVIGERVEIGDYCTLYQGVTIGNKSGDSADDYPVVGSGVTIFVGSQVLGGVHIGNNSLVGANSTVLSDIPEGYIAVGIPAKPIKPVEPPGEDSD